MKGFVKRKDREVETTLRENRGMGPAKLNSMGKRRAQPDHHRYANRVLRTWLAPRR